MKQTILFSDVHLKGCPGTSEEHRYFLTFLRGINVGSVGRLICVGDLFDFWYEYSRVLFSCYFEVLRALADLRDGGVELHLVCGNHDFWAGEVLRRCTGMAIHHEPVRLLFDEKEVLLQHGDGLNPRDYGYRLFKSVGRNGALMSLFRQLHPDHAMKLAQCLSHGSRSLADTSDPAKGAEARIIREYAGAVIGRGEADVVVCGHAHAPEITPMPSPSGEGIYINTGDWPLHRSYVVYDHGEFSMLNFR